VRTKSGSRLDELHFLVLMKDKILEIQRVLRKVEVGSSVECLSG